MIKFYNIRSGETRECETPEMIAAFYNSTNLHVNAMLGQDFGWRIAPETIARMEDIRRNQFELNQISQAFSLPMGEVKDVDVLAWISMKDAAGKSDKVQEDQAKFEREYEERVRAIREGFNTKEEAADIVEKSGKTDSKKQGGSAKIDASSNDDKES